MTNWNATTRQETDLAKRWLQLTRLTIGSAPMITAASAAYAALIVRLLGLPSFMLHFHGGRDEDRRAMVTLCQSLYGGSPQAMAWSEYVREAGQARAEWAAPDGLQVLRDPQEVDDASLTLALFGRTHGGSTDVAHDVDGTTKVGTVFLSLGPAPIGERVGPACPAFDLPLADGTSVQFLPARARTLDAADRAAETSPDAALANGNAGGEDAGENTAGVPAPTVVPPEPTREVFLHGMGGHAWRRQVADTRHQLAEFFDASPTLRALRADHDPMRHRALCAAYWVDLLTMAGSLPALLRLAGWTREQATRAVIRAGQAWIDHRVVR